MARKRERELVERARKHVKTHGENTTSTVVVSLVPGYFSKKAGLFLRSSFFSLAFDTFYLKSQDNKFAFTLLSVIFN